MKYDGSAEEAIRQIEEKGKRRKKEENWQQSLKLLYFAAKMGGIS